MFAVKGETLTEYWDYTHRIFEWPDAKIAPVYSNMILDDGGDATLLLHLGTRAETDISVVGKPASEEEECLYRRDQKDPEKRQEPGIPGVLKAVQGRDRRNYHRCASPVSDAQGRQARLPGDQRQRLGHQIEVRQPVRLP